MDHDGTVAQAIHLMERALSLLEDSDETLAACHLQQAIHVATLKASIRRD